MFFQLFNAADWCKELTIFTRIDYFPIPSISCSGHLNVKVFKVFMSFKTALQILIAAKNLKKVATLSVCDKNV